MRKYFGRNDLQKQQFSKESDQILALNYENLCDDDYLQRLFVEDGTCAKDEDNEKGASENSLRNVDFAEDISIFGDNLYLSKCFHNIRSLLEVSHDTRTPDTLSFQISKQVVVFEHMAEISIYKRKHLKSLDAPITRKIHTDNLQRPIYSQVLESTLTILEDPNIQKSLRSSILLPIIESLTETYDGTCRIPFDDRLRELFKISCSDIYEGNESIEWSKKNFEESTRCSLLGVFGFLSVGLLSNDITDIIVAIDILATVVVSTELKIEKLLRKLKESFNHAVGAVTIVPKLTVLPYKTNSKTKASIKEGMQRSKCNLPLVDQYGDNEIEYTKQSRMNDSLQSENSLKAQGSFSKLREKNLGYIKFLDGQKDISKTKLNAAKLKECKAIHEFDSKDGSAGVVANIPTASGVPKNHTEGEKNAARMVSNNRDTTNRKDALISKDVSELTPRSNCKRVEREIKHSHQTCLRVPRSILGMLNKYCSNLCSGEIVAVAKSSNKQSSKSISTHVWSCGQNSYGELGLNDINMRKVFNKINCLDDYNIVSIGAGNEHSLFVAVDGKLYSAGYNDNGQCGVGSNQQVRQPTLVHALDDEELFQVHVYNGCEHTLALTREGKIFSFGYNYRGQLGLGNTNSEFSPRPIRALMSRKVILAACSYHHSVFLCADGTVFSCGRNDSGQLGHGDTVDKKTPQAILSAPRQILSISCGQFHTVMSTISGHVFVCGKNDYGQLGIESTNNVKVLTKISLPNDIDNVFQVCSGYYHTLLLTNTGIVAGFGRNDYGQVSIFFSFRKTILTFLCSWD